MAPSKKKGQQKNAGKKPKPRAEAVMDDATKQADIRKKNTSAVKTPKKEIQPLANTKKVQQSSNSKKKPASAKPTAKVSAHAQKRKHGAVPVKKTDNKKTTAQKSDAKPKLQKKVPDTACAKKREELCEKEELSKKQKTRPVRTASKISQDSKVTCAQTIEKSDIPVIQPAAVLKKSAPVPASGTLVEKKTTPVVKKPAVQKSAKKRKSKSTQIKRSTKKGKTLPAQTASKEPQDYEAVPAAENPTLTPTVVKIKNPSPQKVTQTEEFSPQDSETVPAADNPPLTPTVAKIENPSPQKVAQTEEFSPQDSETVPAADNPTSTPTVVKIENSSPQNIAPTKEFSPQGSEAVPAAENPTLTPTVAKIENPSPQNVVQTEEFSLSDNSKDETQLRSENRNSAKNMHRYVIFCSDSVKQIAIMDIDDLMNFVVQEIRIDNQTGIFGNKIGVSLHETKKGLYIDCAVPIAKTYIQNLMVKYLKKNNLGNKLGVVCNKSQ